MLALVKKEWIPGQKGPVAECLQSPPLAHEPMLQFHAPCCPSCPKGQGLTPTLHCSPGRKEPLRPCTADQAGVPSLWGQEALEAFLDLLGTCRQQRDGQCPEQSQAFPPWGSDMEELGSGPAAPRDRGHSAREMSHCP